jgi:hypothetical protein
MEILRMGRATAPLAFDVVVKSARAYLVNVLFELL